eukprot:TRINITY_DN1176_c0_g1_i1.p1 TRINITY_DN1176_c0_g1~~TRINITY_DN1176_c0_g1_i1.p1  ORF type:complete len:553 (+),score=120.39 TRINITY_DN1176_c0_g1_i1:117-1661(+)
MALIYVLFVFFNATPNLTPQPCSVLDNTRCQFAFIIDAGSSGSRINGFLWPKGGGLDKVGIALNPEDNEPIRMKVEPGLTSFSPEDSFEKGIRPLLDYVREIVPINSGVKPPLYILATAGMRLANETYRHDILESIRVGVQVHFPEFKFRDSYASVLSGELEGAYSWLAVNYAAGLLNNPAAVVDMGGASMQVTAPAARNSFFEKGQTEVFGHKVFVGTYLKFGANAVQLRYRDAIVATNAEKNAEVTVKDPCIPEGSKVTRTVSETNSTVIFSGNGNFEECKKRIMPLLDLDAKCTYNHCYMHGVRQPKIAYEKLRMFGLSEYWYTTRDVLTITNNPYNKEEFEKAAADYCATNYQVILKKKEEGKFPFASDKRLSSQCFKSAWLSVITHDGLEIPDNYDALDIVDNIDSIPADWTLGAMLVKNADSDFYAKIHVGLVIISVLLVLSGLLYWQWKSAKLGRSFSKLCQPADCFQGDCRRDSRVRLPAWTKMRMQSRSHLQQRLQHPSEGAALL